MSDPTVHITNGIPDSGTGNITTLGAVVTALGSPMQATGGSVAATLSTETTKVIGTVNISASQTVTAAQATAANLKATVLLQDGSGNALTSTTGAIDVNVKSGVNTNGLKAPANCAPVINGQYTYKTIAASTGPTTLGATGAIGDTLIGLHVVPSDTTIGAITITDNATAITVYAGGTYNADLRPFFIDLKGIASQSGAWKVTTLAGASVIAVGSFT